MLANNQTKAPTTSPGPLARAFERFRFNRAAISGVAIIIPTFLAILTYPLWWSFKPNDIDLLAMNAGPCLLYTSPSPRDS